MLHHRRQYSSRDKIELLRMHLVKGMPVPKICQQNKIHPTVFYRWQRQLFSRGHALFVRRSPARQAANFRRKVKGLILLTRTQNHELVRLKRLLHRASSLAMPPPPPPRPE